jgi:hypothetical protein
LSRGSKDTQTEEQEVFANEKTLEILESNGELMPVGVKLCRQAQAVAQKEVSPAREKTREK